MILQFFGGAPALGTGFSGGSEGPAIHLGAAVGSYRASRFDLNKKSICTLLAAGMAAGVAAICETPIAAVILVMEVVLLEVALASLVPLLLAAMTAKTLIVWVSGDFQHDLSYIVTMLTTLVPTH